MDFRHLRVTAHIVGNITKGQISKRMFQENKSRQIFRKTNISYPRYALPTIYLWNDSISKNTFWILSEAWQNGVGFFSTYYLFVKGGLYIKGINTNKLTYNDQY